MSKFENVDTDLMQDCDFFIFFVDDVDEFAFGLLTIEILASSGLAHDVQNCLFVTWDKTGSTSHRMKSIFKYNDITNYRYIVKEKYGKLSYETLNDSKNKFVDDFYKKSQFHIDWFFPLRLIELMRGAAINEEVVLKCLHDYYSDEGKRKQWKWSEKEGDWYWCSVYYLGILSVISTLCRRRWWCLYRHCQENRGILLQCWICSFV